MAITETVWPMPLDASRIDGCLALSAEAGWNQTADDWALFLGNGTVFGILGENGQPVATGAALPYPGGFAWIGMVLVTQARRRERLGTRILESCLAEIERRALVPVLDATPAGEQVYRPLGFEPVSGLTRWQGVVTGASTGRQGVRPMAEEDLPAVIAGDAIAFGARRESLLRSLFSRAPRHAFVAEDGGGFVLARPGRIATQIGPLVAESEKSANALLETALDSVTGPVLVDIADRWTSRSYPLEARNFTVQRPFLRMARGRSAPFGVPRHLFAVAGPEFG